VYTNLDTVAVGVVLSLTGLTAARVRPEDVIAGLKAHPAVAPLVAGGELKEYAAHLIPEGGYDALPELAGDGLLVAGDAAGLCLAAGLWLEGVNFAMGSGMEAGEAADEALAAGDVSRAGLARYRERLERTFVLQDHEKVRRAPRLLLNERAQVRYPQLACDLVEQLFTVENPRRKRGAVRIGIDLFRASGLRVRDVARDSWDAFRTYG
jgi:electron transfer flavoprotein-quinone oxidoreductase